MLISSKLFRFKGFFHPIFGDVKAFFPNSLIVATVLIFAWPSDVFCNGRNEGINVQYECLGGDEYLISVHLFRDCAEFASTPAFLDVFFTSSCESIGFVDIYLQDSQEVSQLCPDSLPSSTCNGGTLPGVNLSIYSGIVTLLPCADWQIIVAEQNRATVLNLVDPFNDSRLHVEAFLNNASGECNTSPQLGLFGLPFVCVGSPFFYNLSFTDPDGDSLVYALTPAITSTQADMPLDMVYEPGYTPMEPIDNLTFNSATGQMNMTPTAEGKYTIVVEVSEYRDGVLVGIVYLDFNVIVIPCAVPPPTPVPGTLEHISGGGYPISDSQISICAGDDFCLELEFNSTDPEVALSLSADIADAIPGATFTQSGINPATIEFCGTVPNDYLGGDFVVTAIDDFCSIYGQAFFAVQFVTRDPMLAGPDTTICAGQSVQLFAENDTTYTWFDTDGNPIPVGPDFSCNPCANPVISTDTSTVYTVEGIYTDGVCAATSMVSITVPLNLEIEVSPETCFENDGVIDIEVLTGSGNYTVVWDDDPTTDLVRTNLNEGTYSVTITDEDFNCSTTRTFTLLNLILPDANAGGDNFACGSEYQLEAVPSFGESLWTSPDPEITISDPTSPNSIVTASSIGVYELIWTEEDGSPLDGCIDSDTISIEFFDEPTASIAALDTVCGSEVEVTAAGTNGAPFWVLSPNVSLTNPFADPVVIVADAEGLETIVYQTVNGPCVAADTAFVQFIDQPVAHGGSYDVVCGDEVNLFATVSTGAGTWLLPSEVIPLGTVVGPSLNIMADTYGFYDIVWQEINQGYCTDSDTVEVGFVELPLITPLTDTLICGSSVMIEAEVSLGVLLWEGEGGLEIGNSAAAVTELTALPGDYQLRLTADNGYGCMANDTLNLTFYEQPVLPATLVDTVCGFEANLVSPFPQFDAQWLSTNLSLSAATGLETQATTTAEGDYSLSLVVGNQGVCFDTTDYALTFYTQPAVAGVADFSVCGLTANVAAVPTIGLLLWSTTQAGATFSEAESAATDFSVSEYGEAIAVIREVNGICFSTDTVVVSFEPAPQIADLTLTCTDSDALYVVSFEAVGDYGIGFEVSGLPGTFTGNVFVSEPVESGIVVAFTLDNSTVCPPENFSGSTDCPVISSAGNTGLDTVRVCGEEPAYAIQINPPELDGNDVLKYVLHDSETNQLGTIFGWSDFPAFSYDPNLLVNTLYYISAVVGNPLGDEIDLDNPQVAVAAGQPVIFLPAPNVSVDYAALICPTETALVPFEFSGNLPQEFTYWFNGVETSVQVVEPVIELAFTDSGMVEPVLTTSAYCEGEGTGQAFIAYHPEPELDLSWNEQICTGDTSLLQISPTGVGPFLFDFTSETIEQTYLLSADTTVALTLGGSYQVTNFSDQLCQLLDTFAVELVEHLLPLVNAGLDATVCAGDNVVIGAAPNAGVSYAWSPDESILNPSLSTSLFAAFNTGFFPLEQQLIVTATDVNCTDSDTVLITVFPVPEMQIFAPSVICQGDTVEVIGYGADELKWSPAQLFSHPDSFQTSLFTSSSTSISLVGTNEAGCTSATTWNIDVAPLPATEIMATANAGCAPLLVDFALAEPTEGAVYAWSANAQPIGDSQPAISHEFTAGQYEVEVEVTSGAGCRQMAILPEGLTVHTTAADFSYHPEKPSITNPKVTFTGISQNAELYLWQVDSLGWGAGERFSYAFPSEFGGSYLVCLDVISPEGCLDSTCKTIALADDFFLYIPTAFTPDGDGLNDLFYPQLSRIDVAEYRFWVTNRYGRVVFDTNDPTEKWNGSEHNSGFYGRSDFYQWHLSAKPDFNVEERFYMGKVMLLR